MTQEQKELLLKDLCARLPYGVKVNITSKESKNRIVRLTVDNICNLTSGWWSECKPYLIPLSKMTEEQRLELEILTDGTIGIDTYSIWDFTGYSEISLSKTMEIIQWCYENHLDINGLIPMGLANDTTGLNIY